MTRRVESIEGGFVDRGFNGWRPLHPRVVNSSGTMVSLVSPLKLTHVLVKVVDRVYSESCLVRPFLWV